MRSLSCTYVYVWAVLALLLPILVLVLRRAMTAPEFPGKSAVRTANRHNSYFDDPRVLGPAVRPVPLHWRDSPARFSRGMASLLRSSKKAVEPMGYARGRDLRTSLAPVGASSQQSLDRISLVVETLLARDGERRRSRGASGLAEETSFAEETSRPGFARAASPSAPNSCSFQSAPKPVPVPMWPSRFRSAPRGKVSLWRSRCETRVGGVPGAHPPTKRLTCLSPW